jgi:hypothetical protein
MLAWPFATIQYQIVRIYEGRRAQSENNFKHFASDKRGKRFFCKQQSDPRADPSPARTLCVLNLR